MWSRKSQYLSLLDNAAIISAFCKSKLNGIKAKQRWNKLYQILIVKIRQYNILKILEKIKLRRYKLLQLIRKSSLIRFYNEKTFLHKIIMYWLIYSISVTKKRSQMKMLYENMLTTYMSMADDIFGKNQKNNPSIQDFMFEIVDSDKYQVKELEDVPIAKTYYSKKKEEKKVITNIKYIRKELEEDEETTIFKETNKYYYPRNIGENIDIKERNNNTEQKKGNLGRTVNLSFNYNDSSIFDNKKEKKNLNINTNYNNNYNSPTSKKYTYKDYSKPNNITGNNNYSFNNTSYSNNNYINTNDYSYKYKKGNSDYKIYNNNDTNISYNKINISNNIYPNIKRDDKDNVLYKGIYSQSNNNSNIYDYNSRKGFDYKKYSSMNKYNNTNPNNYNNFRNNNSMYSYKERNKRNNEELNNNMNYYNKIKPEEKPKYIANYYRRNEINYKKRENK